MDTEILDNHIVEDELDETPMLFHPSLERLRLILMFFLCINLFGFPTAYGPLIRTICGFAPLAFFILSGYLVLQNDWDLPPVLLCNSPFSGRLLLRQDETRSKRIVRAIKRTAITFAVLAVVYFGMSCLYGWVNGMEFIPDLQSKRFWFELIVLNKWEFLKIGSAIWYVQALLYAYIIIFFLDKLKLLRFDWLIAILLIAFAALTSEFSGLFQFDVLGYTYLSGNFLSRALPYVLLGGFIQRKMDFFGSVGRAWYVIGIFVGIGITIGEILILEYVDAPGYYGHLLGMGVIAFSVCMLAFQNNVPTLGFEAVFDMPRGYTNMICYLSQPVSALLGMLLAMFDPQIIVSLVGYIGAATFVICFGLSWVLSLLFSTGLDESNVELE